MRSYPTVTVWAHHPSTPCSSRRWVAMAVWPSERPDQPSRMSHHSSHPRPVAARRASSLVPGSATRDRRPAVPLRSMSTRRAAPYRSPVFPMRSRMRRLKASCRVISTAFRVSVAHDRQPALTDAREDTSADGPSVEHPWSPLPPEVGCAGAETKVGRDSPPEADPSHPTLQRFLGQPCRQAEVLA